MNIHDIAHDLARALKASQEISDIKKYRAEIEKDPQTKEMFDDFRKRQYDIQQQLVSGHSLSPETSETMDKLYQAVNSNPLIRQMFEAENRLSVIMDDIQRIITEPIREVL